MTRPLILLVLVALMTGVFPPPGVQAAVVSQQRTVSGADFAHPDADFYASIDPSAQSEQLFAYARLLMPEGGASEMAEGWRTLGRWVGLDLPLDEMAADAMTWVGNDVFVANSGRWDWRFLQSATSGIDASCVEQGVLVGAAIRSMPAFASFVANWSNRMRGQGAPTRTERHGTTDIIWAGRSPEPGGGVYFAAARGYLLLSNNRTTLVEALDRRADRSLASSARFRAATQDLPAGRLATLYFDIPAETLAGMLPPGGPAAFPMSGAASLRFAGEGIRVDFGGTTPPGQTPAQRALLSKPPSAFRSAAVAPRSSQLFLAWDNLKPLWDVIVENAWPDPADYARNRRVEVGATTYDLEDDVFGWMTGEVAFFLAPTAQASGPLGRLGLGLLVEAKDVALAREKFEKLFALLTLQSFTRGDVTTEVIDGVEFRRFSESFVSVYAAVVDGWVAVTTDSGLAAEIVAGVRRGQGLTGNPEFAAARATFPQRSQTVVYAHVAELAELLGSTMMGGAPSDVDVYLRMVRGIGFAVDWSPERSHGTLYAHVVVPPGFQPPARTGGASRSSPFRTPLSALVDLSHSGLAEDPSTVNRFVEPPEAEAFTRFLRQQAEASTLFVRPGQRVGQQPRDERGSRRFDAMDPSLVEPNQPLLVRVGSAGAYTDQEIKTYQDYVRCGGVLLLLSDQKTSGDVDGLAQAFGFRVAGVGGEAMLTSFGSEAVFAEVPPLSVQGGNGVAGADEFARRIGHASAGSFLDLNGNGSQDPGEPAAPPILVVRPYGHGTVAFLGTTSVFEEPNHPLLGQLLRYLFPNARWAAAIGRDRFEPDDSFVEAKAITLGETQEGRTLLANDNDWVSFPLSEGERVTISTGGSCDTYLFLYGPDGTIALAQDDDSGEGSNARLSYTASEDGIYYARVRHFSPTSGTCDSYRLITSVER